MMISFPHLSYCQTEFEYSKSDSLIFQKMIDIVTLNGQINLDHHEKKIDFQELIFVQDLVDTTNFSESLQMRKLNNSTKDKVIFKSGHIYYFDLDQIWLGHGNILYIDSCNVTVFRSIECHSFGDTIEEAYKFISSKIENNDVKDEILVRVLNYRRYGHYIRFDIHSRFDCEKLMRWIDKNK